MLSEGFQRLYCDATVFEPFSTFHPISFARVLPFQPDDPVIDDASLIGAEAAHLADRNELTRREVIDAYVRCGLLPAEEAENVKSVIDWYGADFFELMGLVYANAGMYICALRWYREFIRELETPRPAPDSGMDDEGVHASVGYCLYALGLFAEAISWTKSCIGPDLITNVVCQALMEYEAQQAGGKVLAVERAAGRTRYTVSTLDPTQASQSDARLKAAMQPFAPGQEFIIERVSRDTPLPAYLSPDESLSGDESSTGRVPLFNPFPVRRDFSDLLRHKMNLVFAIYAQADALVESGDPGEARRLLSEAALLEPAAGFIRDKIQALP